MLRGELGSLAGGCLGPDPGGRLWGRSGGVQPLRVSRPRPREIVQTQGGVSQHALRQRPPPLQQTATAADGTHPTGMHACCE